MQFNSHHEWEEWAHNTRGIISRIDQAITQLEAADFDCNQLSVAASEARVWVNSLEPQIPDEEEDEEDEEEEESSDE